MPPRFLSAPLGVRSAHPGASLCLLLVTVLLAACSGGEGEDGAPAVPSSELTTTTSTALDPGSAAGVTTTTGPGSLATDRVAVGKKFWYGGFVVTLGEARVVPDKNRVGEGVVEIDATIENLDTDDSYLDPERDVAVGKTVFRSTGEDFPIIPGKSTVEGKWAFSVDEKFALEDAVLRVGNAANQQALIPLCNKGTMVDLEPAVTPLSASGTAGLLTVQLQQAEVRGDVIESNAPTKKDELSLYLKLGLTAVARTEEGVYDYAVWDDYFTLRLPNGNTVSPQTNNLDLGPIENDTTKNDALARFEIKNPPAGTYTLVVKGKFAAANSQEEATAEIPFTVP